MYYELYLRCGKGRTTHNKPKGTQTMETKQANNTLEHYRPGTYIRAVWQSVNTIGRKVTDMVVRITNKTIKTNKNGVDYLTLRLSQNSHHKAKITYFDNNGELISKEQYLLGETKSTKASDDYIAKHICDIISLG